ncbi:MAG: hypothetical protein BA863_05860 [Desulfovibrio sp. S3730MH75]|nr:MAG: hypothetical protein BA863_05860 [Desulfovibrio sp. S3730MH75]
MDPKTILAGGQTYTVNYAVKDNDKYDANSTLGKITDLGVLGTFASGGDFGCVMNLQTGFSMDLARLLIVAPVAMCMRRRHVK